MLTRGRAPGTSHIRISSMGVAASTAVRVGARYTSAGSERGNGGKYAESRGREEGVRRNRGGGMRAGSRCLGALDAQQYSGHSNRRWTAALAASVRSARAKGVWSAA